MSNNAYSTNNEGPSLFKTIAVLTLINGIANIFWGLIATAGVVFGTLFIGIICAPVTILPTVLGVFETIYALKLLATPPQPVQPSTTIAILEILCVLTFNVFSMIVGILSLVFYNDPQVKEYFAKLNGTPYPVDITPPAPPAPPAPPKPVSPPQKTPAPESEEKKPAPAPKPKKTTKRKVAAKSTDKASKAETSKKSKKDTEKG